MATGTVDTSSCRSPAAAAAADVLALVLQMYSGALLATAARLAWDPSTYTWFRFLCAAQYRVSAAYVFAAGVWLAALVYLAAAAAQRRAPNCLHVVSIPSYTTLYHTHQASPTANKVMSS